MGSGKTYTTWVVVSSITNVLHVYVYIQTVFDDLKNITSPSKMLGTMLHFCFTENWVEREAPNVIGDLKTGSKMIEKVK